MPVMAETISRSKRLCAMCSMKEPSILIVSTGKRLRYSNELMPAPKSSRLTRQRRSRALRDELFGGVEIGDGGGFGDLEADAGMRRPGLGR